MKPFFPPVLKKGDKVGLITPASPISVAQYKKAIQNISNLGLVPVVSKYANEHNGFIAGTDAQRLADIHQQFADDNIKALWAIRGGYGTTRLLPDIDYALIAQHPKMIVGYSDMTALLNAIHQQTGLITYHAPIAAHHMTARVMDQLSSVIFGTTDEIVISTAVRSADEKDIDAFKNYTIINGCVDGKVVGGNLSLIYAMMGTPYEIDFSNSILLLEDVHEKPYCIDRMLTAIGQSSTIKTAKAIAMGVFSDCHPKETDDSIGLHDMLLERCQYIDKPSLYGLSIGHIDDNHIITIGAQASLNTYDFTLRVNLRDCTN